MCSPTLEAIIDATGFLTWVSASFDVVSEDRHRGQLHRDMLRELFGVKSRRPTPTAPARGAVAGRAHFGYDCQAAFATNTPIVLPRSKVTAKNIKVHRGTSLGRKQEPRTDRGAAHGEPRAYRPAL